jgi:hypothetical protein
MNTDPGPRDDRDSDGGDVHINRLFFNIALPSGLSTASIIIRQLTLSLVSDFRFVTSQDAIQRLGGIGSGGEGGTGLDIGGFRKSDGEIKIDGCHKSDSRLENKGGTAMTATEELAEGTKATPAIWDTISAPTISADRMLSTSKPEKKSWLLEHSKGATAGTNTIVASWATTSAMVRGKRRLISEDEKKSGLERPIEGANKTVGDKRLPTPNNRKKSWLEGATQGAIQTAKTSTLKSTEAQDTTLSVTKDEKKSWSGRALEGVIRMAKTSTLKSTNIEGVMLSILRNKTSWSEEAIEDVTMITAMPMPNTALSTASFNKHSCSEGTVEDAVTSTPELISSFNKNAWTEGTMKDTISISKDNKNLEGTTIDMMFLSKDNKNLEGEMEDTISILKDNKSLEGTMEVAITITAISTSKSTRMSETIFSKSKYKENSWSSEDSGGGVMLGDSLKPLNREANSLVSPTPIRNNISTTGSDWRISRDQSISPTNAEALPCAAGSGSTLHFHRKEHHAQHEHHQSVTPEPFTCTKTRKYMLSRPDPALARSRKSELDINDLTDELQNLAFHRRPSGWVYTPASLRKALNFWQYDREFMCNAEELEARNRFRGIDMNEGWNRAAVSLWNFTVDAPSFVPYDEGGPEIRIKITEMLNRFSFWSQLEPIEWDVEELKGIFDMVFVGEGLGNSGWARKPGSWWGQRKKLFDGHRGRTFLEEIDLWVEEIEDGREKWRREHKGTLFAIGSLKRKASTARFEVDVEGDRRSKRVKLPKTKSEQVMSEAWRARRRIQEKKAGRWTDGTLRMDRMWAEFHWVMNQDNPQDESWPKEIFTRTYIY